MNLRTSQVLRWTIALVAMAMLIWYVGPAALASTLATMHLLPVLAYLGAFLAVPFLYGLQLHGAFRIAGHNVTPRQSVAAAVQSWSIGSLTPARAGDLTLAYFLGGAVPERDALAVVLADKLLSLVVLAALALGSSLVVTVPYRDALVVGTGLVLIAVLVALVALRIPRLEQVRTNLATPRMLLWVSSMATLRWAYICAINVVIFRAVDFAPGIATVTAATAVGRIISIVPVSIGGMGIKEPAQILIYAGAGVTAEAVVAVSVVGMACGFLVAAIAPLFVRSAAP